MSIDSLINEVKSLNSHICVEIVDNYIIVKGTAYTMKGKLKLLGFRWNPKKREWYYLLTKGDNLEGYESGRGTTFTA